jgi:hypothetical protein
MVFILIRNYILQKNYQQYFYLSVKQNNADTNWHPCRHEKNVELIN